MKKVLLAFVALATMVTMASAQSRPSKDISLKLVQNITPDGYDTAWDSPDLRRLSGILNAGVKNAQGRLSPTSIKVSSYTAKFGALSTTHDPYEFLRWSAMSFYKNHGLSGGYEFELLQIMYGVNVKLHLTETKEYFAEYLKADKDGNRYYDVPKDQEEKFYTWIFASPKVGSTTKALTYEVFDGGFLHQDKMTMLEMALFIMSKKNFTLNEFTQFITYYPGAIGVKIDGKIVYPNNIAIEAYLNGNPKL